MSGSIRKILDQLPGKKYSILGNHDKPRQLIEAGITIWDGKNKEFEIDDPDCGLKTFIIVKGEEDPRKQPDGRIAISHEPYPGIEFPYFYGHIHNGPIPFSRGYAPIPIHPIKGRNLCVEVTNYTPIPLPILLHDQKWLDKNWENFFKNFFNLRYAK